MPGVRCYMAAGLVVALIALAMAGAALAAFPGRDGRLLVVQGDDSVARLWTVPARGGSPLSVLRPFGNQACGGTVGSASLSPDGTRIAYSASWTYYSTPRRCVASAPRPGRNGSSMAEVSVVNSDGSHLRRLLRTSTEAPISVAFSPNGHEVAVVGTGDPGILIIDTATGRRHVILPATNPSSVAWGATGELAYDDEHGGLSVVWPDGKGNRVITTSPVKGNADVSDTQPSWSPDGSRISFMRTKHVSVPVARDVLAPRARPADCGCQDYWWSDVYVVWLTGGKVRRLTFSGDSVDPVWSPDGKWIAYTSGAGNEVAPLGAQDAGTTVNVVGSSGGKRKRLSTKLGAVLDWISIPFMVRSL